MMSFRTLILIASVAYVSHGNVVKRSFGHHYTIAPAQVPISSYGVVAPAPVPAPMAPVQAPPAPSAASSYGASSYGAPAISYASPPAQAYGPIFYLEEDTPGLKARIHDFKSRIIGGLGYVKGSILAAKGQMLMKKANLISKKGERLIGLGETLRAFKLAHTSEPLLAPVHQNYYAAPLPAAPGY